MHNPLTVPSDMGQDFDRDGFVKWEQRQPAEVSWWCSANRQGFTALANRESPRMRTSPFSRPITRVNE